MTYWISQPENQLFLVGALLMLAGGFVLILLAFPRTITPEPVEPWNSYEPTPPRVVTTHSEFKYTVMDEWYPCAETVEFLAAVDECAAAIDDLTDTVELDPLDITHELEIIDPEAPLFYTIRRPRPYVAESFTQGITRAQIERARASKELAR